jgi:hypothetical protein
MYCVQNQRTVKLDELVSKLITNLNTSKKNEHIEQVARLTFIITLFKFKECTLLDMPILFYQQYFFLLSNSKSNTPLTSVIMNHNCLEATITQNNMHSS